MNADSMQLEQEVNYLHAPLPLLLCSYLRKQTCVHRHAAVITMSEINLAFLLLAACVQLYHHGVGAVPLAQLPACPPPAPRVRVNNDYCLPLSKRKRCNLVVSNYNLIIRVPRTEKCTLDSEARVYCSAMQRTPTT